MVRVAGRNALSQQEIISGVEPEDPVEQERRFSLLSQDSIYLELGQRCKVATGQARHDLFLLAHIRFSQIFRARDPEAILNDPESFRPK